MTYNLRLYVIYLNISHKRKSPFGLSLFYIFLWIFMDFYGFLWIFNLFLIFNFYFQDLSDSIKDFG